MSADPTMHAVDVAAGLVVQRGRLDRDAYTAIYDQVRAGEVDGDLVVEVLATFCWSLLYRGFAGDVEAAERQILQMAADSRPAGDG